MNRLTNQERQMLADNLIPFDAIERDLSKLAFTDPIDAEILASLSHTLAFHIMKLREAIRAIDIGVASIPREP